MMPTSRSAYVAASVVAVAGLSSRASGLSGLLVNTLSGKCLDVASAHGSAKGGKVQLYPCDTSGADTDQLWELTSDGFIKNVQSKRFLDFPRDAMGTFARLATNVTGAPFAGKHKQWELTTEGQFKNLLNGKCLDVWGLPGTEDGSDVQLWTCEDVSSNTDQLWTFLAITPVVPPKFRGYLVNRLSGKCLDVAGAQGPAESYKLQLYTCPGSDTDQPWELTADGLLKNIRSAQCLDLEGASAAGDGAMARLAACKCADAHCAQRWEQTTDGHLKNVLSRKCLDVVGRPGTLDGSRMQLWQCEDASGNTDQLWAFFAALSHLPPQFTGYVVNRLSGKCLDVTGAAGSAAGRELQLFTCDTSEGPTDQIWELTAEGFFRNVRTELCLGFPGAAAYQNGVVAQLAACESASSKTDQMWEFTLDGHFRNLLSGKCLDVWGVPGTQDGSHLQLLPCETASANINTDQLWVFMATPPLGRALFA